MSLTEIFVGISAIALAAMFLRAVLKPNRNLEYPPGPKGLPLIGNVLDLMAPGAIQQKLYAKWGREFGQWLCTLCYQREIDLQI